MARKDYMPEGDAEFDIFQDNFTKKVEPKLGAWGIPTSVWNGILSHKLTWGTAWAKAKDKDTRSRADVQAKRTARREYEKAIRKFVKEYIAFNSKVTDADREALGLIVKDIEPTPKSKITVAPYVMLKSLSGARIQIRCRTEHDSTRCSKHRDADAIELRYKIGEPAPLDPAQCPNTLIFTRAVYTINLSVGDAGKRFYCYIRWKNIRDDAKSGPWGSLVQTVIVG